MREPVRSDPPKPKTGLNGAPSRTDLHVAEIDGLQQRLFGITGRHEFMCDVTLVAGIDNATHHAIPLHLLRVVEFVTAGYSARMKMPEVLNVFFDGGN